MKNKNIIIAGVLVAIVLVSVMIYNKTKKVNNSKTPEEIDYESPEYQALLKSKIDIALGLKDDEKEDVITTEEWEDMW